MVSSNVPGPGPGPSLGKIPAPMGLTLGRAQSHGLNYILNPTLLIPLGV